ncbi:MAG TPA: DNA-formamidopyrimidine glycosylase family protein [candidate division Zixibacteria bacterium]|nr:DNA-formamidopyrimidine glycosylase family protein [candidate division Zixibacteria bacterium]
MPEGDTIFRTADVLRRALAGSRVLRARAQPRPGLSRVPDLSVLEGTRVERVEALGKHLLIGFSNRCWLRSHMRMNGSWHRYRPGEAWRLPARRATCWLETDAAVAVCFDAPELELLTDAALARHPRLLALGPDLLAASFDADEAVRRLLADPRRPLGEALLDQRVVAGMGNVYKSEVCFIERLDPWAPVGSMAGPRLRTALGTARRLLAANTGGGARVTTGSRRPGASLWVYGRPGRPCRRCGTRILSRRQGEEARLTYWCPRCQGSAGPGAAAG